MEVWVLCSKCDGEYFIDGVITNRPEAEKRAKKLMLEMLCDCLGISITSERLEEYLSPSSPADPYIDNWNHEDSMGMYVDEPFSDGIEVCIYKSFLSN